MLRNKYRRANDRKTKSLFKVNGAPAAKEAQTGSNTRENLDRSSNLFREGQGRDIYFSTFGLTRKSWSDFNKSRPTRQFSVSPNLLRNKYRRLQSSQSVLCSNRPKNNSETNTMCKSLLLLHYFDNISFKHSCYLRLHFFLKILVR